MDLVKKISEIKESVTEKTDQAAEKVAVECTEWTGRETTACEVKKAAAVAGVVALSAGVAGSMGLGARRALALGSNRMLAADPSQGMYDGDVYGEAGRLIAENGGSLNFETVVVDQDFCEI